MLTRVMIVPVWTFSLELSIATKASIICLLITAKFLRNQADATSLFRVFFFIRLWTTALVPFLCLHLTGAQDN